MKKIKIAMAELETLQTEYVKALDSLGAEAVLVGKDVNPEGFDGLLIPGGGDVNPKLYGEDNNGSCGINDELDDLQTAVLDKFVKAGKPVLGICRGHQLINVYFGGTLIQDINDKKTHTPEKDIPVKYHGAKNAAGSVLYNCYGGEMTVNSTHHQAVKTVGNDMTVTAVSDDGYVEGTAHKTLPVITVQWHPEKMTEAVGNNEYTHGIKLIAEFVKICSE